MTLTYVPPTCAFYDSYEAHVPQWFGRISKFLGSLGVGKLVLDGFQKCHFLVVSEGFLVPKVPIFHGVWGHMTRFCTPERPNLEVSGLPRGRETVFGPFLGRSFFGPQDRKFSQSPPGEYAPAGNMGHSDTPYLPGTRISRGGSPF